MEEVWKDIAEFPGYQVSDLGRVRNKNGLILKQRIRKDYYASINLYLNKDTFKSFSIHRLVGIAFIPNPENYPTINHINRNRSDNRLINLEWASYSKQNIERKHKENNTSGHPNIRKNKHNTFQVAIKRNCIYVYNKNYPTLAEAIAGRDEFLASLSE